MFYDRCGSLTKVWEVDAGDRPFTPAQGLPRSRRSEGFKALQKLAAALERRCPQAATSVCEGLEETLTGHRLDLCSTLRRALATTSHALTRGREPLPGGHSPTDSRPPGPPHATGRPVNGPSIQTESSRTILEGVEGGETFSQCRDAQGDGRA